MNHKEQAKQLIDKYLEGSCTPEEAALVEQFYLEEYQRQDISSYAVNSSLKDQIWQKTAQAKSASKKRFFRLIYYGAAASLAGLVFFASLYFKSPPPKQNLLISKSGRILPGQDKAMLVLADGSRITLDNSTNGQLAVQAGTQIVQSDNQIIYTQHEQATEGPVGTNAIEIPRGGKFHMVLPDGTGVWLNSMSSLKYPIRFTGKNRVVELSGEAYFEVKHDRSHPFLVNTADQQIEVLGTHFNVNAYDDEPSVRTTLLNGSVRVKPKNGILKLLVPGQQSILSNGQIEIIKADQDQVMAWKNGDFVFTNSSLKEIMRQISRWYDVDIEFRDDVGKIAFGGSISRSRGIKDILKTLESTQAVHFLIEERRVIVKR
ncbi:FecR family protein [Pedobacter jeongneungensis]|uniref:FecR family protein n=1 Tax=Pedobacter jeongneungensis TaxID=947309 RepID=UPI000469B1A9|nr:FecR family protein [Pedobacter jeongneungensis]